MNLYKIVVSPVTSFCSPLQSDTFFGAFCWSYLYRYGETALQELICHSKEGKPEIIFSNAFPAGRVPMLIGVGDDEAKQKVLATKQERYAEYINHKKKDHLLTITLNEFNKLLNGMETLYSAYINTEQRGVSWRNMVSRESDTVGNVEGSGSLFEVEEIYFTGNYDIYIYSTLDRDILNDTLRDMFRLGIGAQRSIGKGAFEISGELELFDGFQVPEKANGFVALSNFVPGKADPIRGYYKTLLKYPKVSYISSKDDSPFKKPLMFLEAGSVFYDQPVRAFYGTCVEKVALKGGQVSDDIVIDAHTIAVPCCING